MYENRRLGFLFVLPFVLGVLLFKLFPFVMSFALSFTQYDIIDRCRTTRSCSATTRCSARAWA